MTNQNNKEIDDQKVSAAMLTSIQSAGVAPEVNLRITKARNHANGSTLALMLRADVTRSPELMSSNFFFFFLQKGNCRDVSLLTKLQTIA